MIEISVGVNVIRENMFYSASGLMRENGIFLLCPASVGKQDREKASEIQSVSLVLCKQRNEDMSKL